MVYGIFFKRSTSQRKMSLKNNNSNNNKIMKSTKKKKKPKTKTNKQRRKRNAKQKDRILFFNNHKKKKKKKAKTGKETTNPCALTHGYFCLLYTVRFFLSIFSPFWGENILVELGKKFPSWTNIFSSPPSNQIPTKDIFFPLFSPTFSILPKIFPTKQTLNIFS